MLPNNDIDPKIENLERKIENLENRFNKLEIEISDIKTIMNNILCKADDISKKQMLMLSNVNTLMKKP